METNTTTLSGLEPLLSMEELSEYLNVPMRTLYDWRLAGKGPCAVHVGRQPLGVGQAFGDREGGSVVGHRCHSLVLA